jgi:hypothetical protein
MSKVNPAQFLLNLAEPRSKTEPGPRVVLIRANASIKALVGECLEALDSTSSSPRTTVEWDNACAALQNVERLAHAHAQQQLAVAAQAARVFCGLARDARLPATREYALLEELNATLTGVLLRLYVSGTDHASAAEVAGMVRSVSNYSSLAPVLLTASKQVMEA